MKLISRKLCGFLLIFILITYYFFILRIQLALSESVSYFYFLFQSPSSSSSTIFDTISFNRDKVLSINSSAVFFFGDVNVHHNHHKNWLTYSRETDRPNKLCYDFSISSDLTQMVNFPTWFPGCDSHSPALSDLFISPDTSITSTSSSMAFPLM